jgi:hypothetical protein
MTMTLRSPLSRIAGAGQVYFGSAKGRRKIQKGPAIYRATLPLCHFAYGFVGQEELPSIDSVHKTKGNSIVENGRAVFGRFRPGKTRKP